MHTQSKLCSFTKIHTYNWWERTWKDHVVQMDEHALKHTTNVYNQKLKFKILKNSLTALQKIQVGNKTNIKPKKASNLNKPEKI